MITTTHNLPSNDLEEGITSDVVAFMMASAAIAASARVRYLHSAAAELFADAPSTAAALEAELAKRAADSDTGLPVSQRQDVCSACGNILVVGISCTMSLQNSRPRSKEKKENGRSGKPADRVDKVVVYTCKRCSHYTRVAAGPKRPRKTVQREVPSLDPTLSEADPQEDKSSSAGAISGSPALAEVKHAAPSAQPSTVTAKTTSNASSKQRAKARKQFGLQALLAKNKASTATSASSGFDLMDFMKTG